MEQGAHYHTKTGKVLTNEDIEALADEAERGYDVSHLIEDRCERRRTGASDQENFPLVRRDPQAEAGVGPGPPGLRRDGPMSDDPALKGFGDLEQPYPGRRKPVNRDPKWRKRSEIASYGMPTRRR